MRLSENVVRNGAAGLRTAQHTAHSTQQHSNTATQQHSNTATNESISEVRWLPPLLLLLLLFFVGAQLIVTSRISPVAWLYLCVGSGEGQ